MKKIIILTGNEFRHQFFRIKVAADKNITVIASFCEGTEKSLHNRIYGNPDSSEIEKKHVDDRSKTEKLFFKDIIDSENDLSNPILIKKGEINSHNIVSQIKNLNPDLLVCYGSSLIKSDLLNFFNDKFLNVHLGLSPYYRGSGTNIFPLVNYEPQMVGATFMYIDSGVDTGKIIHQIQADIQINDSPHTIGNRFIMKMTDIYCKIISCFDNLSVEIQPQSDGRLYMMKDFDYKACTKLYENFSSGMIKDFLENKSKYKTPYLVKNKFI